MRRTALLVSLIITAAALPADEPDRIAIRRKMELAMGPLPGPERKVPLDPKIASTENLDGYVRIKVTYAVENGDRVPAWLLVPNANPETVKRPAMLCLHQTIAIGKDEPVGLGKTLSKQQALHLVQRGYVCLCRTIRASASTRTTSRPRSSAAITAPGP